MFRNISEAIKKELSGKRAKNCLTEIHHFARWSTFPKFQEAANYCLEEMEKIGLKNAEIIEYPANGKTKYGDWIIPQAWDAEDAVLEIVEPESSSRILASYQEVPCSLFMYSAPTPKEGVIADVVEIKDGTNEKDYEGIDLKGKIVFTTDYVPDMHHDRKVYELAGKQGAIGIISDLMPEYEGVRHKMELFDASFWQNYFVTPINEKKLFGFSLSPRNGIYLRSVIREAKKKGEKVKVLAKVNTRLYDGTIPMVTGVIPGEKRPEEEILLLAHICEQGADNDASGSGLILEIMRCLTRLIAEGNLPRPKRTIRVLLSMECYGITAYMETHKEDIPHMIAGLYLDAVGSNQNLCKSILGIYKNPHSQSSYTDILLREVAHTLLSKDDPQLRWREKSYLLADSLIADPMIGIPCPSIVHTPYKQYHTSEDTPDKLSSETLRKIGILAATYSYFIANAGNKEIHWLANMVSAYSGINFNKISKKAITKVYTQENPNAIDLSLILKETESRFGYQKDREIQALYSVLRLVEKENRSQILGCLRNLEKKIKDIARQTFENTKSTINDYIKLEGINALPQIGQQPYSELEIKMSKMISERLVFGSLTLESLPPEVKKKCRWKPAYNPTLNLPLFWSDRKRTLLDIAKSVECETGRVSMEDLVGYFEFLAKFGYIKLKKIEKS